MANSIIDKVEKYGFNGIDLDMEHRSGDFISCGKLIAQVIKLIRASGKPIIITMVPQMVNFNPLKTNK